jgi:hypothetical protein
MGRRSCTQAAVGTEAEVLHFGNLPGQGWCPGDVSVLEFSSFIVLGEGVTSGVIDRLMGFLI